MEYQLPVWIKQRLAERNYRPPSLEEFNRRTEALLHDPIRNEIMPTLMADARHESHGLPRAEVDARIAAEILAFGQWLADNKSPSEMTPCERSILSHWARRHDLPPVPPDREISDEELSAACVDCPRDVEALTRKSRQLRREYPASGERIFLQFHLIISQL